MNEAFAATSLAFALAGCTESGRVLWTNPDASMPMVDNLVAGSFHACAVSSGITSCWGDNSTGALGTGDVMNRNMATAIAVGSDWRDVASGDVHSCGTRQAGSLWCWGANDVGQLGTGDAQPSLVPIFVSTTRPIALAGTKFEHSCAIDEDHALWCWGLNGEGQLGHDPIQGVYVMPTRVDTATDWLDVSPGQGHTCAIRAPGTMWCWGRNTDLQLGLGSNTSDQIDQPTQVGSDQDWKLVRTGQRATCALKGAGELWCWGDLFALGVKVPAPTRVGSDGDWIAIAVNTFHACGLRANTLLCWGRNAEGQLALGDYDFRSEPTMIAGGAIWTALTIGRFFTCARRNDGTVWCAGDNGPGTLGTGDFDRRNVLTQVVGLP